jgi:hypothetical protein
MPDKQGQLVMDFTQNWRRSDPKTSEDAGKKIEAIGKAERDRRIILACLRQHNGSTDKELAVYLKGILTYDEIHKRMRELEYKSLIKKNVNIRREHCCTRWIL